MAENILFLAGDAGATKTELQLFQLIDGKITSRVRSTYSSRDFETLEDILLEFLNSESVKPHACCVGVPGPVEKGVSVTTNIPWKCEEKNLIKQTGITNCILANDLEILAHSIPYLNESDFVCIHSGEESNSSNSKAVIAPGTGLGQALLFENEGKWVVVPTEGGHADFAPQNELQILLLKYLEKQFGHVSFERILSGPGICNIYDFLVTENIMIADEQIEARFNNEDKAKVITESAIKKTSETCIKAMEIFISVLGAHSGNVVLTTYSSGGIYLAGGIPKKILDLFKSNVFIDAFLNKGRLSMYVSKTPVYVVTHDNPSLLGAVYCANKKFFQTKFNLLA